MVGCMNQPQPENSPVQGRSEGRGCWNLGKKTFTQLKSLLRPFLCLSMQCLVYTAGPLLLFHPQGSLLFPATHENSCTYTTGSCVPGFLAREHQSCAFVRRSWVSGALDTLNPKPYLQTGRAFKTPAMEGPSRPPMESPKDSLGNKTAVFAEQKGDVHFS